MPRSGASSLPGRCSSAITRSSSGRSRCSVFFFSSRRRHTRSDRDWSSDVCSSDLVIWTNEEGARFQPTTMGSAVFAGALPLAAALDTLDGRGVSVKAALAEALAAAPVPDRRPFGFPVAAYLEAHMEQGPIFEATGMTIGGGTGIQGLRWYRVEVAGEEAHAGAMPPAQRRDALLDAM